MSEHVQTGPKTYAMVLGALLVLTIITVAAAYVNFGSGNTVIALVIASIKASLVALFFMHLKNDKFNAVLFLGGAFFLSVFLIFTLFDVDYREPIYPGNLKAPLTAFPGAPIKGPFTPSDGRSYEFNKAPATPAPSSVASPAPAQKSDAKGASAPAQ